jgi:hypothetical protein
VSYIAKLKGIGAMQTQGHRYKENPETSNSFLVRQALSGDKAKTVCNFWRENPECKRQEDGRSFRVAGENRDRADLSNGGCGSTTFPFVRGRNETTFSNKLYLFYTLWGIIGNSFLAHLQL